MDGQGGPPLGFVIALTDACQHSSLKAEAQMPRAAGREHACRCYGERRGGGPTAAPVESQRGQPQPREIELQEDHSRILCKTLPLETFI